jgi:hypothetical protein
VLSRKPRSGHHENGKFAGAGCVFTMGRVLQQRSALDKAIARIAVIAMKMEVQNIYLNRDRAKVRNSGTQSSCSIKDDLHF